MQSRPSRARRLPWSVSGPMHGTTAISCAVALGIWLVMGSVAHADHKRHEEGAGHQSSGVAGAFGDEAEHWADPFPPESLLPSAATPGEGCPPLLDHRVKDLRGRLVDLCAFSGKVLLVVNTASRCGFTPQYKGLQALWDTYRAQGLVVMGFPSNDFGGQEPGSSGEIAEFCEQNYGVRFPMFAKVKVEGESKTPFYQMLTTRLRPDLPQGEISWNFEKFLIGRDGEIWGRFRTRIEPRSEEIVERLEFALRKS